jgi:LacI family transcriptional regulator
MRQRVTVRDVAAAAGVSPATASRVLANHATVSPELARRVLDASTRLGYSANIIARALRTQRTGTIGVVVPAISNPYFIGVVEALEQELARSDRSLMLCDAGGSVATEAKRVDLLARHMVDGLVIVPVSATGSREALVAAAQRVPVVQFDRFVEGAGIDHVGSDEAEGMRQVVAHLREQGCETFAYVGAEPTVTTATERLSAFRTLTRASRRAPAPEYLRDFSTAWGVAAAQHLLATGPLPDAVVCGADVVAIGLLSALRDAGVDVPGTVAVVGFDDTDLDAVTTPRLSSVRQPLDAMAHETVRLLDGRAGGYDGPARRTVLAPELVVRESTLRRAVTLVVLDGSAPADGTTGAAAPALP